MSRKHGRQEDTVYKKGVSKRSDSEEIMSLEFYLQSRSLLRDPGVHIEEGKEGP